MPRLGAYDFRQQPIKRAYARRQFLREIWRCRKEALLELTHPEIQEWAWAHKWGLACAPEKKPTDLPWIVHWAIKASSQYRAALAVDDPGFYERWDQERAQQPEIWFADLVGLECLCGNLEMAPPGAREQAERETAVRIEELEKERERVVKTAAKRSTWLTLYSIDQELAIYRYEQLDLRTSLWRQRENVANLNEFLDDLDIDDLDINELPVSEDEEKDEEDARGKLAVDKPKPVIETRGAFFQRVYAAAQDAWEAACADLESRHQLTPRRDSPEIDRHCEWTVRRYLCGESSSVIAKRLQQQGETCTVTAIEVAITRTAVLLELPRRRKP
jgi:hypothetical protein